MKKVTIIILGFILIAIICYFIWNKVNTHTFEEVLGRMLEDDEFVEQVSVINRDTNSNNYLKIAYLDEQLQKTMINKSSSMELREEKEAPGIEYEIALETDQGRYIIFTNENDMYIGGSNYKVVGENDLINYLDSIELDWKPR